MATIQTAYLDVNQEDGTNPFAEVKYKIFDAATPQLAAAALYAQSPPVFDMYGDATRILPRSSWGLTDRLNNTSWDGRVRYSVLSFQPVADLGAAPEFSFDTTGATRRILRSLRTVKSYPEDVAPDFKGSIGVTKDGVEGVDIVIPSYRWTETHYLPQSFVSSPHTAKIDGKRIRFEDWKRLIAAMTGTVHGLAGDQEFRGYAPGEVLFAGVRGALRGAGDWQLEFSFERLQNNLEENDSLLTIGDFTNIEKRGWEHIWWRTHERKIGTPPDEVISHVPSYLYVEEVYKTSDFADIGIGMAPI